MNELEKLNRLLIIIGGMKCGTTSLHSYLNVHDQISMSRRKELDFFIAERNWNRGVKWYLSQLPSNGLWIGESSPNYSKHPEFPGVPERMARVAPNAKLIYLLRHPIKRAVSSYVHGVVRGWERRPIDEAMRDLERSIHVTPSCYHMQLKLFLEHYDRSNIYISTLERMRADRAAVLNEVFSFLGVEPCGWKPEFDQVRNVSEGRTAPNSITRPLLALPGGRYLRHAVKPFLESPYETPQLSNESLERLRSHYADDVAALRTLTGMELNEWSPEF